MLLSIGSTLSAAPMNDVGKALTIMLGDTHFEAFRFDDQLNLRILNLYLDTLDPEKLYFTQEDVNEFTNQYTGKSPDAFDILLLRARGMQPARDIYGRFATRVVERTEFIETLTDKAAFDFESDILVPRSRKNAPWPDDAFAAQRIWRLRIADELLTEELLQQELIEREKKRWAQRIAEEFSRPVDPANPAPLVEEGIAENEEKPANENEAKVGPLAPAVAQNKPSPQAEEEAEKEEPIPPEIEIISPLQRLNIEKPREVLKTRYLRFKETVQTATDEEIADYFFSAVAQAHDPHSDYLSERENERFDQELRNQLTGIGAELASEPDGATRVTGILVNGPAHRQGQLQPDDRIVAIDPLNDNNVIDITYLPIERVVQLILGRKDTFVKLIIENRTVNDFERRPVIIKRGTIELKDAAASAEVINLTQENGKSIRLGWITIPSFYLDFEDADPSVYNDVKKLLSRLKRENVEGIAIDLRNNLGGSLAEVPRLAGLFLSRGPVVQAKDQKGLIEVLSSTPLRPEYEGPLMVVTNRNSVSSSEIFAAALQDYRRAIIVGESSTFGKGTVQEKMGVAAFLRFMQDPRNAGDLKTTVQKFYRVTGSSTQLRGVVPDIILPSIRDNSGIGERFLPNALPHDNIPAARSFRPLPVENELLNQVTTRSRDRVGNSPDFAELRDNLKRLKKDQHRNAVTLNREKRIAEAQKIREETITRIQTQRERFAETEKRDQQRLRILRLNLEDLERSQLELVDRENDSQAHILRKKKKENSPLTAPGWPSGLDPVKRESIAILEDFISLRRVKAEEKQRRKEEAARKLLEKAFLKEEEELPVE